MSPSGESVELAADQLILPGGVDTNRSYKRVYVAGPIFETGSIMEIKQR